MLLSSDIKKMPKGAGIFQRGLKTSSLPVRMQNKHRGNSNKEDLEETIKSENEKKDFFSFRNEKVHRLEFFKNWCPDNHVKLVMEQDSDEMELESKGSVSTLSTQEFFAVISTETGVGLANAPETIVSLANLPAQKKRKGSDSSNSDAEYTFYELEDIFARGQDDQYSLTLGELNYVSNLRSENISTKHHVFAHSCGNISKQVRNGVADLLKEGKKLECPAHPIYDFMVFGSVITLQQIIDALAKAREFPQLDQLEQLFVNMLQHWMSQVFVQHPDAINSPQLFLRPSRGGGATAQTLHGEYLGRSPDALVGQTLPGQGMGLPQSLPLSVPLPTHPVDDGGAAVGRPEGSMDIVVDPTGERGSLEPLEYQLEFLRLSLGLMEIEARRRLRFCIEMGVKIDSLRQLGSNVGSSFSSKHIILGNVPLHIQGQALLELIGDLNLDQGLGIDLVDAAQRIDGESWVLQREGLWCSMFLRLEQECGFCDFGDEGAGLKPICGFAYGRMRVPNPQEYMAHKDAPPSHHMCTYMAVPDLRVDSSTELSMAAAVRALRSSTLFFQDSVACVRSEVEALLLKAGLHSLLNTHVFVEVRGMVRELEEKLREKNKMDHWSAQEFYVAVCVAEEGEGGGTDLVTEVRKALGMVGTPTALRRLPPPAPVEWTVSGHPFLVCPSTEHESFKSNLPPAVFQASTLTVYKLDCLRPDCTLSMVLQVLAEDQKFSTENVRRVWIAPLAHFDDNPEPIQFSTRSLCFETEGGTVTLSQRTLATICMLDRTGRCKGALATLDSCPWISQFWDICNLVFKNATMGSRRTTLRYQEWKKALPVAHTTEAKSAASPTMLKIGSLTLPARSSNTGVAEADSRTSPPRSLSYRDATAGPARRSFPPSSSRSPSPPALTSAGGGGSPWPRGERSTTRGMSYEGLEKGYGPVVARQSRELVLPNTMVIERYKQQLQNESTEAIARIERNLESRIEAALARQAEVHEARLEALRAELVEEMDSKVAVLATEVREGLDRSLGSISARLAGHEEAIAGVTQAIEDKAHDTKVALLKVASKSERQHADLVQRQDQAAAANADLMSKQNEIASMLQTLLVHIKGPSILPAPAQVLSPSAAPAPLSSLPPTLLTHVVDSGREHQHLGFANSSQSAIVLFSGSEDDDRSDSQDEEEAVAPPNTSVVAMTRRRVSTHSQEPLKRSADGSGSSPQPRRINIMSTPKFEHPKPLDASELSQGAGPHWPGGSHNSTC